MSITSLVVGIIADLKKLTTIEFKRSFRAGYRLKAAYTGRSTQRTFKSDNCLPFWQGFDREFELTRRKPTGSISDWAPLNA